MSDDDGRVLKSMAEKEERLLTDILRWMRLSLAGFAVLIALLIIVMAVCRSFDKAEIRQRYDELRQLIRDGKCQCPHAAAVNNINTVGAVSPLDELILGLNRQWICQQERERDGHLHDSLQPMDLKQPGAGDGQQHRQYDANQSANRPKRAGSGSGQPSGGSTIRD